MSLRATQPADFRQILVLNEESERSLSPLDAGRLARLHSLAAYHRVFETGDRVSAFLLAIREGAAYDSPNYGWFAARYPKFLYIDRVVVDSSMRCRGIGRACYEDLFSFARSSGVGLITCEFDIEPPNPASRRFHEHFRFVEVGTQTYGPAEKRVSLRAVVLDEQDGA
jgi:predicted GNAT superfamily acetyltransferase